MAESAEEKIVLTPKKKSKLSTTLLMQRVKKQTDESKVLHVAGGAHKGIVINKDVNQDALLEADPPHLVLQFKVYLQDAARSDTLLTKESRILRFWYKDGVSQDERMKDAHEFFKELVRPNDFPRDYVGFIKKIMKMMQLKFMDPYKIEVEMTQQEELVEAPVSPREEKDDFNFMQIASEDRLLELIELAYPNALSIADLQQNVTGSEDEITEMLQNLERKNLIKQMDNLTWMRVVKFDADVKMVKQMPKVAQIEQPTIAIITALYPEKVAVDAMIENQQTFVRYKTEGEANVYTLGDIGSHRVVCTKLPSVGHTRSAMIAAGNTTTRLLGTFQKIEYVFLVGVGGGVPHYTDYKKHIRLGDVVVSAPEFANSPMYIYCEERRENEHTGNIEWDTKTWCPADLCIQTIAANLVRDYESNPADAPWNAYLCDGINKLKSEEASFDRPSVDLDRLFMNVGSNNLIEVSHPEAPDDVYDARKAGIPVIHFGRVVSGNAVVKEERMRQAFAVTAGVAAYDQDFDAVTESVYGSRIDCYAFIRGIADYVNGTKGKEWQPYAALAAAAFMKEIILRLPRPSLSED